MAWLFYFLLLFNNAFLQKMSTLDMPKPYIRIPKK